MTITVEMSPISRGRTLRGLLAALGDDSPAFRARTYQPRGGLLRRFLIALADASPAFTGRGLAESYTAAGSLSLWKRLWPKRPKPPHQAVAFIEMRLISRRIAGYFTNFIDRAGDLATDLERARAQCVNLSERAQEENRYPELSVINRTEKPLEQFVVDAGTLSLDVDARRELTSNFAATAHVTRDRSLVRIGTEIAAVLTEASQQARGAWSYLDMARKIAVRLAALIGEGNPPRLWEVWGDIDKILDHYAQAIRQEKELAKNLKTAIARNPAHYLESIEIDASGVDLSDVYLPDIDILDLVIWTDQTTWPLAMKDAVREYSVEIRKDVYQVRIGGRLRRERVDV
jgi:hypothetical protein